MIFRFAEERVGYRRFVDFEVAGVSSSIRGLLFCFVHDRVATGIIPLHLRRTFFDYKYIDGKQLLESFFPQSKFFEHNNRLNLPPTACHSQVSLRSSKRCQSLLSGVGLVVFLRFYFERKSWSSLTVKAIFMAYLDNRIAVILLYDELSWSDTVKQEAHFYGSPLHGWEVFPSHWDQHNNASCIVVCRLSLQSSSPVIFETASRKNDEFKHFSKGEM